MKREKISEWLKLIIRGIIIIGISGILGFSLLLFVYMLPVERMKVNVQNSIDEIIDKGPNSCLIEGNMATKIDGYTDSIMLNNSIYDGKESILKKASAGYRYEYENCTAFDSMIEYLKGNVQYKVQSYARYWHGYLIILKPLLLFLQYKDIKVLNAVLHIFLLGIVIREIVKRKLEQYLYAFLGAIVFMFPIVISMCMQYSTVFSITLIALIVMLKKYDVLRRDKKFFEFYLIIGIMVCYFDFLTYPVVSLGFLLLMQLIIERNQDKTFVKYMRDIIQYSFGWCMGYVGIWVVKWIIASIFMKENIIKDAILSILYRSSSETSDSGSLEMISRIETLVKNISVMNQPICVIVISVGILFVITKIVLKRKIYINSKLIFACVIIICIPIMWVIVLANHSYVHYWMVYRVFSIAIFAMGIILISFIETSNDKNCRKLKGIQ